MSYFEEKDAQELREAVLSAANLYHSKAAAHTRLLAASRHLSTAKEKKRRAVQQWLALSKSHIEACAKIAALETRAAQMGKIVEFTESITP